MITTRLMPKLALITAATVGLYIPTVAMPTVLGSCLRTAGTASAAPSPTCANDLRECLRLSAKTGIYGARYVTAEDVARCVEAFNSCIHGGASRGGNPNPPPSTSSGGDTRKGLPARLGIQVSSNGDTRYDCRVSEESVSCTASLLAPFGSVDSYEETFTGTLSGLTASGSFKGHQTGHAPADPTCHFEQDLSGPATYAFNLDGSVVIRQGPAQSQGTYSCSGPTSYTVDAWELTGSWTTMT